MAKTEQPNGAARESAPAVVVHLPEDLEVHLNQGEMTRYQLRLECLKIALQRGLGVGTEGMQVALNESVDLYERIVTGEFRGPRADSAAPGTPKAASDASQAAA